MDGRFADAIRLSAAIAIGIACKPVSTANQIFKIQFAPSQPRFPAYCRYNTQRQAACAISGIIAVSDQKRYFRYATQLLAPICIQVAQRAKCTSFNLLKQPLKESLNNISIPSNRTLNFKNSALDFQDEAGFA